MNPGALRHPITIEQPQLTRDTTGEAMETWVDFARVRAAIEPLAGRELFLAQQVNATLSHRVTLRYLAGVLPTMRVRYGTRVLLIAAPPINKNERNRELELLCTEVV